MSNHTVWLASYPKSGNTWVRVLLTGLRVLESELDINELGHGPIASARGPLERVSSLVASDLTSEELGHLRPMVDRLIDAEADETRYRKIHDALFSGPDGASIVASDITLAAVYIIRDPRDVAVSFAHHAGRSIEWAVNALGDEETAFAAGGMDNHEQVAQHLGSWSHHVRGWCEQPLFPVEVVRYEDLHADPAAQLRRIAELGKLKVTREAVDRAVSVARFESLRALEQRDGFRERAGERQFFRRGRAGSWRDELAPALARQVERDHGEVMRAYGYLTGENGKPAPRATGVMHEGRFESADPSPVSNVADPAVFPRVPHFQ
jgi:hypothetical protein